MKYLALTEDDGTISQVITYVETGNNVIDDVRLKEIETTLEPFEIIETMHWDVSAETFVPHAKKESHLQKWNSASMSYEYDISATKMDIKRSVDSRRVEIESSTVSYRGDSLDADAEAIKNINGKLQELQAKETLNLPIDVNSLFWRDADNVIHTWTDATAYKAWLQGLVIAIAERNSSLYQIAWQKKAEIDALTTIEELLAYDVEAGW